MNIAVEPRDAAETASPGDTIADRSPTSPQQSVSAQSPSPGDDKPPYPASAWPPTQEGPHGVRFDFNDGARIALPDAKSPWRVRLSDLDTGNILYDTTIAAGRVSSAKRYYVRARIEVWQGGASVLTHDYSADGRDVLIQFPVGTLGDTMGWFPYAVKFKELHGCRLTCAMSGEDHPAVPRRLSGHHLRHPRGGQARALLRDLLALGLFFDDKDFIQQPTDFRHVGLHRTAGYILGVDPTEAPPRIALADDSRPIAEPYVCIARAEHDAEQILEQSGRLARDRAVSESGTATASSASTRSRCTARASSGTRSPTAPRTRPATGRWQERARWLKHAEFFVGLSSGLSWLAWAVGAPVVMISGFTHPDQRVRDAVPGDQLARLQQLLERPGAPLRPQGLPLVPAPQGHAAAVRMHAADHGRARQERVAQLAEFRVREGEAGMTAAMRRPPLLPLGGGCRAKPGLVRAGAGTADRRRRSNGLWPAGSRARVRPSSGASRRLPKGEGNGARRQRRAVALCSRPTRRSS